jgi:hypothetical protein
MASGLLDPERWYQAIDESLGCTIEIVVEVSGENGLLFGTGRRCLLWSRRATATAGDATPVPPHAVDSQRPGSEDLYGSRHPAPEITGVPEG